MEPFIENARIIFMLSVSQKGVDMRIGIDIASLAFKKQVDQIILISGDSDFVPAAKQARREGIDFILDPMRSPIKEDLFEHIDGMRTKAPWLLFLYPKMPVIAPAQHTKEDDFMAKGVRKRGKTWSYYFDTAKINGERKKIEKGGFRTQKEALEARAAAIAEYKNVGRVFSPKQISVADYLDYWLENAVKKNIDHGYSYNTYNRYEYEIRLHIKPRFGKYELNNFQYATDKVQEWTDDLKIKGYSKGMIKSVLSCFRTSMNYAIHPLGYIKSNPCNSVKIGKVPVDVTAKEHAEYVCPKEEFQKILERFSNNRGFYLSLLVPYNIGIRIGEIFAIDLNEDIDFQKHELYIKGQMIKVSKTWFLKPPKYESYRHIKIGNLLEQELKNEIRQRKINKLKYGPYYVKTYLLPDNSFAQFRSDMNVPYKEIMPLCVKENGELLTPDSFKYCARVVHYELGNKLFHSHCLRHTHGTILAENGVNPKTVMERLGHKDIKTTLQTYTFNTNVMQQNAVDIFEKATQA